MDEQKRTRRRFTTEKKAAIVAEAKATSVAAAAEHHDVDKASIYRWMGVEMRPINKPLREIRTTPAPTPKCGIAFHKVSLKPEQMSRLRVRHMPSMYDGLYEQIRELRVPGNVTTERAIG